MSPTTKAWLWNHRASWSNILTGWSSAMAAAAWMPVKVAGVLALIFTMVGVTLNGFPDIPTEKQ